MHIRFSFMSERGVHFGWVAVSFSKMEVEGEGIDGRAW